MSFGLKCKKKNEALINKFISHKKLYVVVDVIVKIDKSKSHKTYVALKYKYFNQFLEFEMFN